VPAVWWHRNGPRYVRSAAAAAAIAAAIAIAIAIAIEIFTIATLKTSHLDRAHFDAVQISLDGWLIVQLVFGVLGALSMTSEYGTGMIRTTFAAVPRRRRVLAAKAAIVGAVSLIAGELIALAAFSAGQLMLREKHLNVTLTQAGVLRAVLAAGFYMFIMAMVGLRLGTVIRHTAGAVAAVGLVFIQPLIVNAMFPDPNSSAGNYVLWWAGQSISSIRPHEGPYPPVGQSFAVCGGYAAIALITAAVTITRRAA
jgi:ABC-2 type transport system permease protein